MSEACAVCHADGGWHTCICGRPCRGFDVLQYHIERVGCADLHDLSQHNARSTRRERANRGIDANRGEPEALEVCEACSRPLEIDGALRAAHLAAHDEHRYWCSVCLKSFKHDDEWAIMRHENSKEHLRKWRANLLQGSMRALPTSEPSVANKRRLDAAASAYDKYRRVDQHVDNNEESGFVAAAHDDGFDGGDRSTEDGADIAELPPVALSAVDFAPDDPPHEPAVLAPPRVAEAAAVDFESSDSEDDALDDDGSDSDGEQAINNAPVVADADARRAIAIATRRSITQHFVPAPVSAASVSFVIPSLDSDRTIHLVPPNAEAPECSDLTLLLIGVMNQHRLAREPCRQLFKVLHSFPNINVAATYESACLQVAARDYAQCANAELLSVELPILDTYERDVRDTSTHATVAYRDPMMLLAGELVRCQGERWRAAGRPAAGPPSLRRCVRVPTDDELAEGAAQFAMFSNDNTDITSWDALPTQAPSSVWASAAMHESRAQFRSALQNSALYVGVSITHDGAMMFRRQECVVFRVRFTATEDAPWLEVLSVPAGRHDEHDIYEFVFLPFLRRLRSGVRFRRMHDFVDIVGSLFDIALDKKAAVGWLCINGNKTNAQFTSALSGTADFRTCPVTVGADERARFAWRSLDKMAVVYERAIEVAGNQSLTAAKKLLARHGMALHVRNGTVLQPIWLVSELDWFRRAGALRVWPCHLHQSALGWIGHLLTRMVRSLARSVADQLNVLLKTMPRCYGVEHLGGDSVLFRFISSQKGAYFNGCLATMSGRQKQQHATKLVAVLDHMGDESLKGLPWCPHPNFLLF